MPTGQEFKQIIADKLDSGANILWINLMGDEGRCERFLRSVFTESTPRFEFCTWDVVSGASWDASLKDPAAAIAGAAGLSQKYAAVLFRDLHLMVNSQVNFQLRRALAELCKNNQLVNDHRVHPLIILSDNPTPHPEIRDYCDVIDYDLPTHSELVEDVFNHSQESLRQQVDNAADAECSDELRDHIVEKLLGLSAEEAQRILNYAIMRAAGINDGILPVIADEKAKSIAKINGLKFVPYDGIRDESTIAGFEICLQFVHKRKWSYTRHAQDEGVPRPRGIALVGPPGTGKTMVAMAIAKILGLDLIMMDIGSMYDSLVGSSEKRIRQALGVVAAMPNCVLMVDEIDKALANAHTNAATDSGVSSRMLSYFLNWLSERDMTADVGNRTFVIVTMNRTAGLPPEMLRAGRFDRIFSTAIPDATERKQHVAIQLERYGIPAEQYGKALGSVVNATDGYSGAEIEEVVVASRHNALAVKMDAWQEAGSTGDKPGGEELWPDIEDLLAAASEITPLSRLDKEAIDEITKFCQNRTTPVTGHRTAGGTRAAKRIRTRKTGAADASAN
jgi:hypothetical protein